MTITEFLLARIAEDKEVARAATQGRWFWSDPDTNDFPQGSVSLEADQGAWNICPYFCVWSGGENTHRGEPGKPGHEHRAVEAVVDAWGYDAWGIQVSDANAAHIARWDPARVLAECEAKRLLLQREPCDDTGVGDDPCHHLRALAVPYADHPDYREEWRP
jgi:hypothetical protein